MFYKLQLFKGIFNPSYISYQLSQAEKIPGLWLRICLLIVSSGFLYFLGSFYGVGNELLSKNLITHPGSDFESIKLLFVIGETIWGLFFAAFMLFLPALFFWSVTEIPYQKLLSIQAFVLLILLIGKAIHIPLALFLGIDQFSSPLTFGVIIQYFTSNEILIILFGSISLIHFWVIYLQYTYIKKLTEKSPWFIIGIIVAMNVFLLIVSTLLYYIKIENLI